MTDQHTPFAHGPDALLEQHDSRTWLRVHEIAEFEFCPRAGVLARLHAGKNAEEDHDGTAPRLGYLPDFDIAGLRRSLDRISHEVFESLYVIAGGVVMAVRGGCCIEVLSASRPFATDRGVTGRGECGIASRTCRITTTILSCERFSCCLRAVLAYFGRYTVLLHGRSANHAHRI